MMANKKVYLPDTGERMIPPQKGEVSIVFSRHQFVYQYAQQFVAGKDVIDIGCGTGYGCKILSEHANRVVGLDYDQNAIEYCQTFYNAPNIEYRRGDAANLNLDEKFDVAVSFQVIEHMHDAGNFIDRIKKGVKKDGLILITTPNAKHTNKNDAVNPFHFSEMNFEQFDGLLRSKFETYRIYGIGDASENWLRSLVQKLPFYKQAGLLLKRGSHIKKVASKAMDLTNFQVVKEDVSGRSVDLFAICTNN